MCCETKSRHGHKQNHGASCGCGGSCSGPMFWSKKKRIKMVEHSLKCLRGQVKDLEDLLEELQEEN